jgi:hypothetical protein
MITSAYFSIIICDQAKYLTVMAGLVPAIHVLMICREERRR